MTINPLSDKIKERVLIDTSTDDHKILLQSHEVKPCIKFLFTKYKGCGARKLYNTITKSFCGVTEREIQRFLNRQQVS